MGDNAMTAVMSNFTAPSTPEQAIRAPHPGIRRSFTVPTKVAASQRLHHDIPEATPESVETLFACATAKVVSFSQPSSPSRPSSSSSTRRGSFGSEQEFIETLPWASSTERTVAVGPLRIYRVPGSVSFLHSGDLLHAILPKSQCWCVDGESKFVFRIRQTSYYRIELPSASDIDRQNVEELKIVFARVLQYETTACPFKRGFHVELPVKIPVRKRPWRPPEKAKRWKLDELDEPERDLGGSSPMSEVESYNMSEDDEKGLLMSSTEVERVLDTDRRPPSMDGGVMLASPEFEDLAFRAGQEPTSLDLSRLPKMKSAARSVTAPPQVTLESLLPSELLGEPKHDINEDLSDSASLSSSANSFHSIREPAVLPDPCADPSYNTGASAQDKMYKARHQRELSELTITSADQLDGSRSHSSSSVPKPGSPSAPIVADPSVDAHVSISFDPTSPPKSIELRYHNRQLRHRASQPLFSQPSHSAGTYYTTALIQRTYEILLSPPAHLIAIMLRIAANFADRLRSPRKMTRVEKMAGAWVSSESDDERLEDDFGMPLGRIDSTRRAEFGDEDMSENEAREIGFVKTEEF